MNNSFSCLKGYSTDFIHKVQLIHHEKYNSACENSYLLPSVAPDDVIRVISD